MKVFDVWGAGGSRWLCSNYTFNTSWINDNYYYKIVILFFFSSPKFYPTKVHQLLENLVYQALALCQLFLYSKYSCLTLPLTWHPSFLWELLADCYWTVGFVFLHHCFVGNSSNNCKGNWFYEKFIIISYRSNKNMEDCHILTSMWLNTNSDEDCWC